MKLANMGPTRVRLVAAMVQIYVHESNAVPLSLYLHSPSRVVVCLFVSFGGNIHVEKNISKVVFDSSIKPARCGHYGV
jgi:hypothetical protein